MGHTKLILKCDNEPAIKKLVEHSLRALRMEIKDLESITKEYPERYESQSNGMVEVGIKILRGHYRTLKSCLERRIGAAIPVDHPVLAWLLGHCCLIINAVVRGEDGLTSWARARGRPFHQRLIGFAETCLFKLPLKGPDHNEDGNMAPRWKEGIFIGYARDSNSYLIYSEDGVRSSRAVMRRPMESRWSRESIQAVAATPWDLLKKPETQVRFEPSKERLENFPEPKQTWPRKFKILAKDLQMYGYTVGCQQCDHIERYGESKGGITHGETCRSRIMEELSKDPAGRVRVQNTQERVDRALAESVEKNVQEAASTRTSTSTPSRPTASSRRGTQISRNQDFKGKEHEIPRDDHLAQHHPEGPSRGHGEETATSASARSTSASARPSIPPRPGATNPMSQESRGKSRRVAHEHHPMDHPMGEQELFTRVFDEAAAPTDDDITPGRERSTESEHGDVDMAAFEGDDICLFLVSQLAGDTRRG